MKFVYCPAEIRSALVNAGVDLRKLVDLGSLANILSPEDVAFYLHLNLDPSSVMPAAITQSLTNAVIFADKGPSPENPYDRIQTNHDEIMRVLNGYSLNGNAPTVQTEGKKLVCDLMDENTILFSHAPLVADEASDNSPEGLRALLDRLIQQLVVFHPFEDVARMPLFGGYLRASQAVLA